MSASPLVEWTQTANVIREGIERCWHLGVQVFVSRQGRVLVDDALGDARPGEPLTSDHLMLWLSAGKPLAAILIAQLIEQGKLHWDEVIAQQIPKFASGGKHEITIRHLLCHTGGFRNVETGWPDATWDQIVARICEAPLEADWVPGTRAGYHIASSWFILGELIRRVDGRSFEIVLREAIARPLGLPDLWNGMPETTISDYVQRLAPMFVSEAGGNLGLWPESAAHLARRCAPGGNTRATARDLGRVYEMLLAARSGQRGDWLGADVARELTRRQRVGMFDETFRHVVDFGLGFIVNSRRYGPNTVPYGFGSVASDESFGHGGSQSSIAFADPQRDLVVAIACNGRPGEGHHQRRMRNLLEALETDLAER